MLGCAVLALTVPALPSCTAGGPSPCTPTPVTKHGDVPSVQASPATAAIVGILTDGHVPRPDQPTHILWLVDVRRAAPTMHLIAGRQNVNQSFQQTVKRTRISGTRAEYDSTLRFPTAGCWMVQASTGPAQATVTFDIKPSKAGNAAEEPK